jgi:phospholipid/cholesterol/gamma-HCH transport system permease protein
MGIKTKIHQNQAILVFTPDKDTPVDVAETLKNWHIEGKENILAEADTTTPTLTAAEVYFWQQELPKYGLKLDISSLPKEVQALLGLSLKAATTPPQNTPSPTPWTEALGKYAFGCYEKIKTTTVFAWETCCAVARFVSKRAVFRGKDFWFLFADCSYRAVGIVALVSFLVGLILAFVGALQLRLFGAGIYVASMVTLEMTRIMAAIMVGIIMAGRTGSSFAATLGTMQVNEEIDALKTLGIKISDYLIAPRVVSLVLTIPFLTLLADVLGVLGGAVVGICFLDISSASFFEYAMNALSLSNILVGLFHSLVYGIIIAICGCYAGLNAGRDADSVGTAATTAVVTSLVWMIVATGILTILFEEAGV